MPPIDFWPTVYVFVLATFIGLGVIRRVSRLLHTPLMSLTNAISATNIVSGFLITDRMLKMFKNDSRGDGGRR
jgi:H+-translocating NAD(P) transhydrogenase subunit alpha